MGWGAKLKGYTVMRRGPAIREAQHRAGHWDEIANERAWRKLGVFRRFDTHQSLGMRGKLAVLQQAWNLYKRHGGKYLETYGDRVRPLPGMVLVRRWMPDKDVRDLGVILDPMPRFKQDAASWYTVVAVGDGVTGVAVGDEVLASAHIGVDARDAMGDEMFLLHADLPGTCLATFDWLTGPEHGSLDAAAEGCRCGGDMLAVRGPG